MEKFKNKLQKFYKKFLDADKRKRAYLVGILAFVVVMVWAFI